MKKNFLKTAKEKKENEIKQKLEEKLEEKTIKFLKPKAKNIYLAIKNNKLFLKENVNAKKTIEKESGSKLFVGNTRSEPKVSTWFNEYEIETFINIRDVREGKEHVSRRYYIVLVISYDYPELCITLNDHIDSEWEYDSIDRANIREPEVIYPKKKDSFTSKEIEQIWKKYIDRVYCMGEDLLQRI
jgi:hypothetical protein